MRRAHLSPTLIILFLLIALSVPAPATGGTLTMEDRVEAQRAIEGVYWRHRIWPSENPTPKPPLTVLMPDDLIRARVEGTLAKSIALEILWNRPVTAVQLQAELNRMARSTRNPAMLSEIFHALDNDPLLLAESLARPVLVDRLIHGWYAGDARFHGSLRAGIEEELRLAGDPWEMKSLGGRYAEVEIMAPPRDGTISHETMDPHEEGSLRPGPGQWHRLVGRLARALEAPGSRSHSMHRPDPGFHRGHTPAVPGDLPIGRISAIVEDTDAFSVHAVLSRDDSSMRIATVRWPKRSFDAWWEETRRRLEAEGSGWREIREPAGSGGVEFLEAPSIAAECCAPGDDDIWHPTYTGPAPSPTTGRRPRLSTALPSAGATRPSSPETRWSCGEATAGRVISEQEAGTPSPPTHGARCPRMEPPVPGATTRPSTRTPSVSSYGEASTTAA